jgi:hypothetical protein
VPISLVLILVLAPMDGAELARFEHGNQHRRTALPSLPASAFLKRASTLRPLSASSANRSRRLGTAFRSPTSTACCRKLPRWGQSSQPIPSNCPARWLSDAVYSEFPADFFWLPARSRSRARLPKTHSAFSARPQTSTPLWGFRTPSDRSAKPGSLQRSLSGLPPDLPSLLTSHSLISD